MSQAAQLTPRQREIAEMIAVGLPNKAIAAVLHISIKTVEKHRSDIYNILGIHDTALLTHYVLNQGWIENRFAPETPSCFQLMRRTVIA